MGKSPKMAKNHLIFFSRHFEAKGRSSFSGGWGASDIVGVNRGCRVSGVPALGEALSTIVSPRLLRPVARSSSTCESGRALIMSRI